MRRGACAGSGGTGRTTLLAKLVGDDKNCKWIYRFWANLLWLPQSGPSVDGHFLSLRRSQTLPCPGLKKILILLRFLVGFRHSSTNFHALQSRKSLNNNCTGERLPWRRW